MMLCSLARTKKLVKKKKALFMAKWECQDLGDVKEFLRMRITCTRTGITIDQCNYLEKVLIRCQLTDAKAAITPLPMIMNKCTLYENLI